MTSGIYKITNCLNNRSYIGASKNIEKRWNSHRRGESNIGKDILKYGSENFTFTILKKCPKEEFIENESYYIGVYDTFTPKGYNLSKGGEHPWNTTGYYKVSKNSFKYRIGYSFVYKHRENGKVISISSYDILELEKKVRSKGYVWKITDEEKANQTLKQNREDIANANFYSHNPTGFYRVSKRIPRGYSYNYFKEGKHESFYAITINKLEAMVKDAGFPWEIIDEQLAEQTIKESLEKEDWQYNTTGFYRVHKHTDKKCTQGFFYVYQYSQDNVVKQITSTDLDKLEDKVKSKGLDWKIVDEDLAHETKQQNMENMMKIQQDNDSTGFYRVSKNNSKKYNALYKYYYKENDQSKALQSINIRVLEENVKKEGLPWKVINVEKAEQTLKESDANNMKYMGNGTGYYRVSTQKEKRVKQGFVYRYMYYENGKKKSITSTSIKNLEEKVKSKGLEWKVTNETLAKNIK